MKSTLFKIRIFFTRGHSSMVYVPWGMNIVVLLFVAFGELGIWFGVVFLSGYVVLCVFYGRWDYVFGTWNKEVEIQYKNNPEWARLMKKIDELQEDISDLKLIEVKKIMREGEDVPKEQKVY